MWLFNNGTNIEVGISESALALPLSVGKYDCTYEDGTRVGTIIITILFVSIIIYLKDTT